MATIKVCNDCGGMNVFVDARAEWDVEQQEWVLNDYYPGEADWCNDCEAIVTIIDKEDDQ